MRVSRREFVQMGVGGAAGMLGAAGLLGAAKRQPQRHAQAAADVLYHAWTAQERAPWVAVAPGLGGNMMVVVAGEKIALKTSGAGPAAREGALLVDTMTAPLGAQVRREAEHLGAGSKISYVVNTHHHEDVTGGNIAFQGRTIIAHADAKGRIIGQANRYRSQVKEFLFQFEEIEKRNKEAAAQIRKDWTELHTRIGTMKGEDFAPTGVLAAESREMDVGGRKVVLHRFNSPDGKPLRAHTDNDLVVQVVEANIVHTGGLLSYKVHAVIDPEGGASSKGWLEALSRLEKLCDAKTVVVPGEGATSTGLAAIAWQREYLQALREAVGKAIDQGKPRTEVRKLKPKAKVGPDSHEDRLAASLDSVYLELTQERKR